MLYHRSKWLSSLAIISLGLATANAGLITSASTGGTWTDTATWVGGVVPVPGDDVVITATTNPIVVAAPVVDLKSVSISGSATTTAKVTCNAPVTTQALTIGGDVAASIAATGSVTATTTMQWTGANVQVMAAGAAAGKIIVGPTCQAAYSSVATTNKLGVSLEVQGQLDFTQRANGLSLAATGAVSVAATGSCNVTGGQDGDAHIAMQSDAGAKVSVAAGAS